MCVLLFEGSRRAMRTFVGRSITRYNSSHIADKQLHFEFAHAACLLRMRRNLPGGQVSICIISRRYFVFGKVYCVVGCGWNCGRPDVMVSNLRKLGDIVQWRPFYSASL